MAANMGRGINLGNVLSAPVEGNWAPAFTESYFEDIKNVGFKTVRIPIDFFGSRTSGDTSGYSKNANTSSSYTGNSSDYIIKDSYLDRIEQVIKWSLNNGLITILDFHGSTLKSEFSYTFSSKDKWSAYYTHPTSAKRAADNQKFRAIWTQIANRFKEYSDNLLFEVINEPYFWVSDTEMDILNSDIISIIRNSGSKNLNRNIIITGGSKNSYEAALQIGDAIIKSDDNLIATFHYYWPRAFTASAGEVDNDFDWGTTVDKTEIDTNFGFVKSWSQSKNIPVLLGEFGADNEKGYDYSKNTVGDFGGPDKTSREEFHRYLAQKAIDLGFSFTVWDAGDKSNKTIYKVENRGWVTGVRNALLGINCLNSEIIKNADIECGFDTNWSLFVQTPAVSAFSEAQASNSRNSSKSLQVNVTTSGAAFNKIILKNALVDNNTLSGKTINFSAFAKGSVNNLQFKIRIKTITNGTTVLSSSSNFTLSNSNYQLFEYEYKIPQNTTSLEFQVLCGNSIGTYYFDDFSAIDQNILNVENDVTVTSAFRVYPNPANQFLNISSTKKIKQILLRDINSKIFTIKVIENQIDVSKFSNGIYFLQVSFDDNTSKISKIIITNN
ncbi:hypothetical protein BTO07_06605 [Polaribacter sp. SA4-12]|nr:hypothetical protein BTO07_06605 [Polaribacter sp. SA4-12]